MRYNAVLLDLVVLRTKGQNGFCPMCTKEYYIVLTRSNPFWGQFWGQIGEAGSHTHRANKCAALGSLENTHTHITGFSQWKSPKNQYISFTLQQEVVCKPYSTTSPHAAPVAAKNAPVWAGSHCIGAVAVQPNTAPNSPHLRLLPKNGFSCAGFAQTGFTCTGKARTNK